MPRADSAGLSLQRHILAHLQPRKALALAHLQPRMAVALAHLQPMAEQLRRPQAAHGQPPNWQEEL